MESSQSRGPGQNKRFWTEEEDKKLIEALLELHDGVEFAADGNFKPGHLKALERLLLVKLPYCDLKAKPHIESRMKTLKTHFNIVHDMITRINTGFSWDMDRKTVRAPKPVWDAYLQVSTKEIPAPKDSGLPLNAYMLHNLAHVELNAIDLAWDIVVRFSPLSKILGEGFFADFAHVADDESRHFAWCSQRLAELGFKYGDMPAHNLLWRECEKTSDNVAARVAAIPLVQEARGLDAGPRLVQKLIGFGDHRTSQIVGRIADEEVAHVAVGVYWFVNICEKMGCAPCTSFRDLLKEYNVELKGPFNYSARDKAGIPRDWYDGSSSSDHEKSEQLSPVYKRLAAVISMENENSSMNGSS